LQIRGDNAEIEMFEDVKSQTDVPVQPMRLGNDDAGNGRNLINLEFLT
jgi:hypothetical protein